jgi:RNA polymerase sigma-70 factor (ECF subfamily)
MELDDHDLVRQSLAGHLSSFERLVEKYQKAIYNAAFRMTHSRQDAEDITQTAFIKAFEHLSSYRSKYRFFSWLYRIAVNEALNFLKASKRESPLEYTTHTDSRTPEVVYEESRRHEMVHEAVLELPLDYRVLVVLKHFQGFSYKEIGYIVGIPEQKVKSRLFTARSRLKDILTRKGLVRYDFK